jgi:hypothetical protein
MIRFAPFLATFLLISAPMVSAAEALVTSDGVHVRPSTLDRDPTELQALSALAHSLAASTETLLHFAGSTETLGPRTAANDRSVKPGFADETAFQPSGRRVIDRYKDEHRQVPVYRYFELPAATPAKSAR